MVVLVSRREMIRDLFATVLIHGRDLRAGDLAKWGPMFDGIEMLRCCGLNVSCLGFCFIVAGTVVSEIREKQAGRRLGSVCTRMVSFWEGFFIFLCDFKIVIS